MIRGLLFVGYLLIRFLAGDVRLGCWKVSGAAPRSGTARRPGRPTDRPGGEPHRERRLRAAVSLYMLREGRRLVRRAGDLTGFSLVTESALPDLPQRFVLVSNHQSLLDIPVLIAALPGRTLKFVAKRSLKYGVPLVSKCLRYGGDALIVRPRGRINTAQIRALVRELRRFAALADEGACPVIFADGSRSRDGAVHQFHSGGLAIVLEGRQLPIVTAALDGGYRLRGLAGLARMGTTRYRVKFLSVYQPPENKAELRKMVQRAQTEIAAQIERWRRPSSVLTPG